MQTERIVSINTGLSTHTVHCERYASTDDGRELLCCRYNGRRLILIKGHTCTSVFLAATSTYSGPVIPSTCVCVCIYIYILLKGGLLAVRRHLWFHELDKHVAAHFDTDVVLGDAALRVDQDGTLAHVNHVRYRVNQRNSLQVMTA